MCVFTYVHVCVCVLCVLPNESNYVGPRPFSFPPSPHLSLLPPSPPLSLTYKLLPVEDSGLQ